MYICSCMVCVSVLPVYLLSMHNIYLGYEKTDVGRGVIEMITFDYICPFFF